jgi:hypothetical protein
MASFNEKQIHYLKECQRMATEKGGECLDSVFISSTTKVNLICKEGHRWASLYANLKKGKWCKICFLIPQQPKISDCTNLAESKNGKCLESEYISARTKMRWECQHGHKWRTTFPCIKRGQWCPACNNKFKMHSLADCQNVAKKKGGICLDTEYVGVTEKMNWQCHLGHRWKASFDSVRRISWCPQCFFESSGNNLKACQEKANERGGICLEVNYKNSETKMGWQCHLGHRWKAIYHSIKRGLWCPRCAIEARKTTMEQIHNDAKKIGLICLSKNHKNNLTKLTFKCLKSGHITKKSQQSIKNGRQCTKCNYAKGELITKKFFEKLFKFPFGKVKLKFLKNTNGRLLELDGYSHQLKIAFEHNGDQHYRRVLRYHKTELVFQKQLERDQIKINLCREEGIALFIIPQVPSENRIEYLKDTVKKEAFRLGINLPNTINCLSEELILGAA